MTSKTYQNGRPAPSGAEDVETLYHELLKQFYEDNHRARARKVAARLEKALAASPEYVGSIRADEIGSLLAELRGDFVEAARSREAEIRKILHLHTLAVNTPSWEYVSRQYDFRDVSDRLDLLALLYDYQGDVNRAIATLIESKHYCRSHRISFDGQELLEELEQARDVDAKKVSSRRKQRLPSRKSENAS